jgi:hypothetical protein
VDADEVEGACDAHVEEHHKTEEKHSCSNEQKNSMSKEQLPNKYFVLKMRVKELEDMTLKQQKEVTGESRFALHNISGKFSLVDNLPEKIQIHQDEIERLKKENNQLLMAVHRGIAVGHDVDTEGVREDAHTGECDDWAQERLFENTTGVMEHVEKNLLSRPPVQGDQVDEAPTVIRGGVPNDGGGEVQGNQEVHHQDDAWQEVLSKVEKMQLDTTVTFVEDRETGKTATKILGGRLASSQPNQVQDSVDQRPCNPSSSGS